MYVWLDICDGCVSCGADADGVRFSLALSEATMRSDEGDVLFNRGCEGRGGGSIDES